MRVADTQRRPLLVVVGPTAVGKTEVAIALAEQLDAEIVSADSMQVYQEMNIGTAKPSLRERVVIPHHMVDVVSPDTTFNVADYVKLAEAAIKEIRSREKLPVVTGGTGLYIHALVDGFLFPQEGANQDIRERLYREAAEDRESLFAQLTKVDPQTASRLHPNDVRRVVRALEVYLVTGTPISELQRKANAQDRYQLLMVGLVRKRSELYRRINRRVDAMIEYGLVGEVARLLQRYPHQPTALQALGYKEIARHLRGEASLEEAVDSVKRDTRRYAKRQLSWFRRDSRIVWHDLDWQTKEAVVDTITAQFRTLLEEE